ncbi:MAG TPA: glycosyltransferase [Thermoanaerobaculia bacterium]|jgi:GT2 family glycosyltransferase
MTSAPVASVVLPVWNGARYLAAAIESILGQSLQALELIVVDDGSTDASLPIARTYAARDARVVVLPVGHGGLVRALNAGIAAARGRYIARIDADDVADRERLARQVAFLEARPECILVGSSIRIVDEDERELCDVRYPLTHAEIEQALLTVQPAFSHPSVLMRRDALLEVGGYRAERFPSEDLDLWLRLVERGQLANLSEPLLRYRRHHNTISARQSTQQRVMTAKLIDEARRVRNLAPLAPRRFAGTSHHMHCARLAILGRNRRAAIAHARAELAAAPLSLLAYVTLFVALLPERLFPALLRVYASVRTA